MSFITKHVVDPDERLIYVARIHWIYMLKGLVWFIGLSAFGFFLEMQMWKQHFRFQLEGRNPVLDEAVETMLEYPLPYVIFTFIGFCIYVVYMLKMIYSEVALTDTRLIYKTGWLNVEIIEVDFTEILGERVHHGFIGAIFGCGSLHLDSRFIGDVYLPYVTYPHRLLKSLHKARSRMPDPMSQVATVIKEVAPQAPPQETSSAK